jgi:leucyl aminopeptidase (aminopeptidase T)
LKEIDMTRTPFRLLLAAMIAAASAIATAQPAPVQQARDPATMYQRMTERHEARMAQLKEQLKLTAGQQAAWNTFAQAMQPLAQPVFPSREEISKLTPEQRAEMRQQRLTARQARMEQHKQAMQTLRAQLTPEQQATLDQFAESVRQRWQEMSRR